MQRIYGEGKKTVPGLLVDDEPVHGSRAILARLDELAPEKPLYPSDEVRVAEQWGDEVLQDLGRRLPRGSLQFRPEAMGSFAGAGSSTRPGSTMRSRSYARHGSTTASVHSAWPTTSQTFPTSWTTRSGSSMTASSEGKTRTPRTCRSGRRCGC